MRDTQQGFQRGRSTQTNQIKFLNVTMRWHDDCRRMRLYQILWAKTSPALIQVRLSEPNHISRLSPEYLHLSLRALLQRSREHHFLFFSHLNTGFMISTRPLHNDVERDTNRLLAWDIAVCDCPCVYIIAYVFIPPILTHAFLFHYRVFGILVVTDSSEIRVPLL